MIEIEPQMVRRNERSLLVGMSSQDAPESLCLALVRIIAHEGGPMFDPGGVEFSGVFLRARNYRAPCRRTPLTARSSALLFHQRVERRGVNAHSAFLRHQLGQVERKAECVIQFERLLPGKYTARTRPPGSRA